MKKIFIILLLLTTIIHCRAQFAPPAGQLGSTAIHKDSSVFVDWANSCVLYRGLKNISVIDSGYTTVGNEQSAVGKAGDGNVVSLGDGGSAILTFSAPIYNDNGFDFAVFENSFDGMFLELAHVEVSSDGVNFFRFPSASLTDTTTQIGTFGTLDARKINNLAGKYKANYGTPFDLQELSGIPGLDIMNISHVKIIDVVGSINNSYCTRDASGRKINDPWPTAFNSGGFDLDGVGVIHSRANSLPKTTQETLTVYPTLLKTNDIIHIKSETKISSVILLDLSGKQWNLSPDPSINLPASIQAGIYTLFIETNQSNHFIKIAIVN